MREFTSKKKIECTLKFKEHWCLNYIGWCENLLAFIKFRVQAYELLKNIYSKMGDYENEYKTFEKYDELKKEADTNHSLL